MGDTMSSAFWKICSARGEGQCAAPRGGAGGGLAGSGLAGDRVAAALAHGGEPGHTARMVGILGSAVAAFLAGAIASIIDARRNARAFNQAMREAGPSMLPLPTELYQRRN